MFRSVFTSGRMSGRMSGLVSVSITVLLVSLMACESARPDSSSGNGSSTTSAVAPAPVPNEAAAGVTDTSALPPAEVLWPLATEAVGQMGDGVNFGSALEAPNEGEWGVPVSAPTIDAVAAQGFGTVRLPVRWSGHAGADAPFTIDAAFFARVDTVIDALLARDLVVVVDVHHYEDIMNDPGGQAERFLALWRQISTHYAGRSPKLWFELLNEPHTKVTGDVWNALGRDALAVVRETNPKRIVVIGPVELDSADHLAALDLPTDPYLMSTIHYYGPIEFTHAGASWIPGGQWTVRWSASNVDGDRVRPPRAAAAPLVDWSRASVCARAGRH